MEYGRCGCNGSFNFDFLLWNKSGMQEIIKKRKKKIAEENKERK